MYLSLETNVFLTNNTEIPISDISASPLLSQPLLPPLVCHTDLAGCCGSGSIGLGDWYYPDGSLVQKEADSAGTTFFSSRELPEDVSEVVGLFRQTANLSPTGLFCCVIPTTQEVMTFYANTDKFDLKVHNTCRYVLWSYQ